MNSTRAQNGKYPYFSASLDRALDLLAQNNFFKISWASAKLALNEGLKPVLIPVRPLSPR